MEDLKYDEIGPWSEVKLDIIKDYAAAYSKIICAQKRPSLHHVYIDAFAGAGRHKLKYSGEFVLGSPANALLVRPKFKEYHFIDLNKRKIEELSNMAGHCPCVSLYKDDCNRVLVDEVFPRVRYEDYRRGLCILDPYGLHLNWEVLLTAGKMKSIDIFLNFPIMDINMNVLHKNPENVRPDQVARFNAFWGDESWRNKAYVLRPTLFGDEPEKVQNETLAEAFRERLKKVAGFKNVPKPLAMSNRSNAIVYYLYFASQKDVANDIVEDIFGKYSQYKFK